MTWDQQYREKQGRYFPNEEFVRFLGRTYDHPLKTSRRDMKAVDIGCGVGGNCLALAAYGFTVHGLDASEEAIKLAGQWLAWWEIIIQQLDLYTAPGLLPFDHNSIDLAVDVQTSQHLSRDDHETLYAEVARVLKSGGHFFLYHWMGVKDHARKLFPEHPELCDEQYGRSVLGFMLRRAGLVPEYMEWVEKSYPNGATGEWAVIAARKI